jgi:hypothetical protein
MAVPKAAMYENDHLKPRKDEIGCSRKIALMKAESESQFVCNPADY